MPSVMIKKPEELAALRERLLSEVGLSEDDLRARSESYELTPEQAAILREIEDIDFLLDG